VQVNIHKLRIITDLNEEMLQYQQTTAAQKCFFDPCKPFDKRLFNEGWQKDNLEKKKNFQKKGFDGDVEMKIDDKGGEGEKKDEVVVFSLKRVMKALNNYILNEYQKLFNLGSKVEDGSRSVKQGEFVTNPLLLKKARDELKFCENKQVTPEELI
jgi:hypothetical protein